MPQAILLADHENLGTKGTVVDVSKGYLRNYLIPRKLADQQPGAPSRPPSAVPRRPSAPRPMRPPPRRGGRGAARQDGPQRSPTRRATTAACSAR